MSLPQSDMGQTFCISPKFTLPGKDTGIHDSYNKDVGFTGATSKKITFEAHPAKSSLEFQQHFSLCQTTTRVTIIDRITVHGLIS